MTFVVFEFFCPILRSRIVSRSRVSGGAFAVPVRHGYSSPKVYSTMLNRLRKFFWEQKTKFFLKFFCCICFPKVLFGKLKFGLDLSVLQKLFFNFHLQNICEADSCSWSVFTDGRGRVVLSNNICEKTEEIKEIFVELQKKKNICSKVFPLFLAVFS